MATRQERLAARKARIDRQAAQVVEAAVERVVAARPIPRIMGEADRERLGTDTHPGRVRQAARKTAAPSPTPSSAEPTPEAVKVMRDGGASWMEIGKHFGLPGAKYGAGRARALYAATNGGVVPRAYKPRTNAVAKPQGPASKSIPAHVRKQALVDDGHVIPRDYTAEQVEAYVCGRTIEWAIDMARLTNSDPEKWGPEDTRFFVQEARVHIDPRWVQVVDREEEGKDRVLYFREYAGRDDRGNHMSGPTRVVRVDAIFTVR